MNQITLVVVQIFGSLKGISVVFDKDHTDTASSINLS